MFVFWRGNGGLAFVVLAPVILLATGLFVQNLWVRYFGSTALLMLGGWFCYRYGKRWNAVRTLHTLYFIPMQYWGMFYIAVAIGLTCLLAGLNFHSITPEAPFEPLGVFKLKP